MTLLYNTLIFLALLLLMPKWLWQRAIYGKERGSLLQRLGKGLPRARGPSIWIHMVSVGEVRAMSRLYSALRKRFPEQEFFLSTITTTGLAEARRSLPEAAGYFLLPLDFSWTMRRLVKRLQPTQLLLSEGDLWLQMLLAAKQFGARTVLVSGKLSERSARRYAKIPFFSQRLFNALDLICAQNALYAERFFRFSSHVVVTGNLKLDLPFQQLTLEEKQKWQQRLQIAPHQPVLVIASTHPGEEERLVSIALQHPELKILLVPRHPERFDRVFASLPQPSGRFSKPESCSERLVLIDAMGLLTSCYQLATLAIVGGSFIQGIGGHNILEPIQAHVPVLFGPHMEAQSELVSLVLTHEAGVQLTYEQLPAVLNRLLKNSSERMEYSLRGAQLAENCKGGTAQTLKALFP